MLNMVCLNLTMKLVFCKAAMMAMKDASMTMGGVCEAAEGGLDVGNAEHHQQQQRQQRG